MSMDNTPARIPLLRLSFFAWVLVPAVLFAAYLWLGLPHVLWRYQFTGSYSDLASRTYHQCTWWGPFGRETEPALNGTCAFIRFFHAERLPSDGAAR